MSLNLSTAQALNDMVSQDPALHERLCGAANRQEFTDILVTAALAKGLTVDSEALGQMIDTVIDMLTENDELSDEQLENVVGGLDPVLGCILGGVIVGAIVAGGVLIASEVIRAVNKT